MFAPGSSWALVRRVAGQSSSSSSFWRRGSAVSSEAWWLWTASRSVVGRSHSHTTTATRRASRSLRSRAGSDARRPRSRPTSTTRLMLTKDLRIARALTPCSARRTPSTAPPGTYLPTARRVGRRRAGLPQPRAAAARDRRPRCCEIRPLQKRPPQAPRLGPMAARCTNRTHRTPSRRRRRSSRDTTSATPRWRSAAVGPAGVACLVRGRTRFRAESLAPPPAVYKTKSNS